MSSIPEGRAHIPALHEELLGWHKEVDFYRDEIAIFEKNLGDVADNYTDKDFLKRVGHFESQFRLQRNALDEFRHEVGLQEKNLKAEVEANPVAYEHRLVNDHAELRGQYKLFVKLFGGMKDDFHKFLAQYR